MGRKRHATVSARRNSHEIAVAWAAFITVARWIPAETAAGHVLVLFGAYTPGIVALLLTARIEGGRGVSALLHRLTIANVPVRLYVVALSYIAVVEISAAILHRLVDGSWPPFGARPLALIALSIAVSTPFQAGEEIGWRGFALPRLADRFGRARRALDLRGMLPGTDAGHARIARGHCCWRTGRIRAAH